MDPTLRCLLRFGLHLVPLSFQKHLLYRFFERVSVHPGRGYVVVLRDVLELDPLPH